MSKPSIITIGTFDGVHRGHQKIFQKLIDRSKKTGFTPRALVFTYPPKHILNPSKEPLLLTLWQERKKLIQAYHIQQVKPISFTKKLSGLSPKQYLLDLRSRYNMREMVVGYNFAFGKGRKGHVVLLKKLAQQYGIRVHVVPPVVYKGTIISSSVIRQLIKNGDIARATSMLKEPFSISSTVIHGMGWGRKHGIPTANLRVSPHKLLPLGVFAVDVMVGSHRYPGVANIGFRPSIKPVTYPLVEVHLLHRSVKLYDKIITVRIHYKIRNERLYKHMDHLADRIKKDIAIAHRYFDKKK